MKPIGVDVSSGVEREAGVKDATLIREFRSERPGPRTGASRFMNDSTTSRTSAAGSAPSAAGYVPETLVPALDRLEELVASTLSAPDFQREYATELNGWAGRPTALTRANGLSRKWGAEIWLKREDLAHTGAHKINNAIGQALLARRMGAKHVVAETGAGQHGVACAAACARLSIALHRVHGLEGHRAATSERRAHEAPGRRSQCR